MQTLRAEVTKLMLSVALVFWNNDPEKKCSPGLQFLCLDAESPAKMLSSLACRPPLLHSARGRTTHSASVCSFGRDGGTLTAILCVTAEYAFSSWTQEIAQSGVTLGGTGQL